MGRRAKALDPGHPLQAFAIELKALRDAAGPAGSVKATCDAAGINKTTYYAWLAGKQLPSRDVLEVTVRAWGGDPRYWIERRRRAETVLSQLSDQRHSEIEDQTSQNVFVSERAPFRSARKISELSISPDFDAARSRRVGEARDVLGLLGLDGERSNERSAYTLLSLLALGPEDQWERAQMPVIGITGMMEWMRSVYGKVYAPNSRESIRRLTLHGFIEAGLVIPNPDRPDRPVNSPRWCFQIAQKHYPLLCSYGTPLFERRLPEHRNLVTRKAADAASHR